MAYPNTSNDSMQLSSVPAQNTCLQTDNFLIVTNTANPVVMQASLANAFSNVTMSFNGVIIKSGLTPSNSNSTPNVSFGSFWSDGNYIYVGCANNVVKRVALSTF